MRETGDAETARRAAWFACIAAARVRHGLGLRRAAVPPALGRDLPDAPHQPLRRRRALRVPWPRSPVRWDVVIALPAAIEAGRWLPHRGLPQPRRARSSRCVAASARAHSGSCSGCATAPAICSSPITSKPKRPHRGRTVDPFTGVWNALSEFFDHDRIGPLLHVGWAVIAIALVVVTFRRLPVSYGLFAAATLVVALVVAQPRLVRAVLRSTRSRSSIAAGARRAQPAPRDAACSPRWARRCASTGSWPPWLSTCPDYSSLAASAGYLRSRTSRSWRATRWPSLAHARSSPRSARAAGV